MTFSMAAKVIKSMTTYVRLIEAAAKKAEDALSEKLLEVKDPKVPALLAVAANWQRARDVEKNLALPASKNLFSASNGE